MPEPAFSHAIVSGSFDDLRSRDIRFLEEASRLGALTVVLWPDEAIQAMQGKRPKFPLAERIYLLNAIRYVGQAIVAPVEVSPDTLPLDNLPAPACWVVTEGDDTPAKRAFCQSHGVDYHMVRQAELQGFPALHLSEHSSGHPKVIVTGCYDWFHSGHVRFFEEASRYGDLYVVVGNDVNVHFLKGEGHPLFPQDERRYIVQSCRFVHQALITSGMGWMDAEPEIDRIKPDIYIVNEDGDRLEKREFCQQRGIQYVVLKRAPKPGLAPRQSTDLRGF